MSTRIALGISKEWDDAEYNGSNMARLVRFYALNLPLKVSFNRGDFKTLRLFLRELEAQQPVSDVWQFYQRDPEHPELESVPFGPQHPSREDLELLMKSK